MKLSTKTRYGARILIELASHAGEENVQVRKIAENQKIPVKYLEQLLRILKLADLVISVRGPKGGHRLKKDPKTISLGQLVRIFEGQTDLVGCVSAPEKCDMAPECAVRQAWYDATNALYEKLDAVSIDNLVKKTASLSEMNPSF